MARARLGQTPEPDFLLWPENSTDIDPVARPASPATTVAGAAAVAGVPILVGAVTEGPGPDERQTTALWWDPVRGPVATYHKRNLVPFGEWIPFRAQLLPLVPILREVGAAVGARAPSPACCACPSAAARSRSATSSASSSPTTAPCTRR